MDISKEKWEEDKEAHCPKCGEIGTVYYNTSFNHSEDNAGHYYICLSCYHDWHMYDLDGYNGIEFVKEQMLLILAMNETNR